MAEIVAKEQLAPEILRFRVNAPRIAQKRKAGQFVIVRAGEESERIPLTIANSNPEEGWIELIVQVVGSSTMQLAALEQGRHILDLVGPLGRPTHIDRFGRCLCIGGGIGIAPLYPIICALKDAGNEITAIIGARTAELLILEEEVAARADRLLIATDDGTKGRKGFAADLFTGLAEKGERFDAAMIIGPLVMMNVTSRLTVQAGIRTWVSLNPIMIDGTGMCGGCRVEIGGETKFACVDGPEFDASLVDWEGLSKRLAGYRDFETASRHSRHCALKGNP